MFQSATSNYSFTCSATGRWWRISRCRFTRCPPATTGRRGDHHGNRLLFLWDDECPDGVSEFRLHIHELDGRGNGRGIKPVLITVIYTNHAFAANYIEANVRHTISVVTSPTGLVSVSGAGTYTNGETANFSAPAAVTNAPYYYTFKQYTLSNTVVSSSNHFSRHFRRWTRRISICGGLQCGDDSAVVDERDGELRQPGSGDDQFPGDVTV